MKAKLFIVLAVTLALVPSAASFADDGAPFVLASRIFSDKDAHAYGPFRERYAGSASKEVQAELTRFGYYHGPIDGNAQSGTPTSRSIACYQRDHRLPVTGAIDGGLIASLSGQ